MTIKINYYGILTDFCSCQSEDIQLTDKCTVEDLISTLLSKYPQIKEIPLAIFIQNRKANKTDPLSDGIAIDCMPPFAGG